MRRILLTGLMLATLLVVSAQDSYFGINLGSSMPKNDFNATSDLKSSGYAMNGFSIQFDGIYFPVRFIGVGGLLGFGSIYPDKDSYLSSYIEYLSSEPAYNGLSVPLQDEFNSSSGFWNYFNIMVGPEAGAELGRFQLGLRAMGGLSFLFYPKMEISYADDFDDIQLVANGTSLSPGYLYGGSIMFKLNRGSSIKFSADYFTSKSRFDFDLSVDGVIGTVSESDKNTVNVETLHLSLGLNYLF